jgi:hypothetical protein
MKSLTLIFAISFLSLEVFTQYNNPYDFVNYSVCVSQISSGSGQGSGYALGTKIQKGRKALEVAAIYKTSENKIKGGDFKYKVFLGNERKKSRNDLAIKPYIQYNLVYQTATIEEPVVVSREKSTIEIPGEGPVDISTMEHYAAFGLQLNLVKSFYFDGSFGFGAYLGSVNKTDGPGTLGVHKENHGYTYSMKFGVGYSF